LNCKKVIIQNYCKAMIDFGISDNASGYILEDLSRAGIDLVSFRNALRARKDQINTFRDLKQLLSVRVDDSEQVICFKIAFQKTCIIFLKYFSSSWILTGNLKNKSLYLSFKEKILQNIRGIHVNQNFAF